MTPFVRRRGVKAVVVKPGQRAFDYYWPRSQSPSLRDGYNHAYNIDTNIFVFEKLYDTLVCTAAWHLEIESRDHFTACPTPPPPSPPVH